MSNVNPYAPPEASTEPDNQQSRSSAARGLRLSLAALLFPALYNFAWYHALLSVPTGVANVYGFINGLGLAVLIIAIWFFGLAAFELAARLLFKLFARYSKIEEWNSILYSSLNASPGFALCGAALWILWIVAFYELEVSFYTVSIPVGITAHLLAAGLYLPMFHRWFCLEKAAKSSTVE